METHELQFQNIGDQIEGIPDLLFMSKQEQRNGKADSDVNMLDLDERGNSVDEVGNATQPLWCEECGVENIGECFIHGGNFTIALDNQIPSRALLSLPKILTLRQINTDDGASLKGRGVIAKESIKARTLFGPLEASACHHGQKHQTGVMEYSLKIADGGTLHLDTSDENKCNWMIFVRPAITFAQQNVTAFQKDGNIFFVTSKDIPIGVELRIWYAAAYAKSIGKSILYPISKEINSSSGNPSVPEESFPTESLNSTSDGTDSSVLIKRGPGRPPKRLVKKTTARNMKKERIEPVLGRTSRTALRNSSDPFTCNTCNTSFQRLSLLDSHVCKELGEKPDQASIGIRKRKTKQGKFICFDVDSTSPSVTSIPSGRNECKEILVTEAVSRDGEEAVSHSENLIPTTATMLEEAPEEENSNQVIPKRGRGRPKGSKSKKKSSTEAKDTKEKLERYPCSLCKRTFSSKEQCSIHEAFHNCTEPFECPYEGCEKSFNSKFKYQRHAIIHERPNQFSCKFCSSTFNRIDHLKNHMLVHDNNRSIFTCDICGKSYLYKSTLLFHKAKHMAQEGNELICLVCEKTFSTKEDLNNHLRTHNRYKPTEPKQKHYCPKCDKEFNSAKDIRRHMVTHTKERSEP